MKHHHEKHHEKHHHEKKHHMKHGEKHHHEMREKHMHEKNKMIDNRHVSDNHQQGIERVKMRAGELDVGQPGKMGMSHKHKHPDHFKRSDRDGMTPVKG